MSSFRQILPHRGRWLEAKRRDGGGQPRMPAFAVGPLHREAAVPLPHRGRIFA